MEILHVFHYIRAIKQLLFIIVFFLKLVITLLI